MTLFLAAPFQDGCAAARPGSATVRIDVRRSDDAIRLELLRYTPTGTDAATVLEFVHTRLYSLSFGSTIGIIPRAGIVVRLGSYSSGLFIGTVVDATWKFDNDRKLRSISISRGSGIVSVRRSTDPTVRPKVRIALRHSDKSIREELLEYTPLGSQMAEIEQFAGLRLYSQSGLADGVALTGKAGLAVILGEYGCGQDYGCQSIRVPWRFNDAARLEDILIRRVRVQARR